MIDTASGEKTEELQAVRKPEVMGSLTEVPFQAGEWIVLTRIDAKTGAELGKRHSGILTNWGDRTGYPIQVHRRVYIWSSAEQRDRAECSDQVTLPRHTDLLVSIGDPVNGVYPLHTNRGDTYWCERLVSQATAEVEHSPTVSVQATQNHAGKIEKYEKDRLALMRRLLAESEE